MATKHIPAPVRQPGRVVGRFGVQPKGHKPGDFNPLVITWTVNKYRRDYNKVVEQTNKKPKLPKYEASLFESCFKNWG